MRLWFAVPQEDAASVVRDFRVIADFPVQYFRDDWGNRVAYVEINAPGEGPITIREEFGLTRTEIDIWDLELRLMLDESVGKHN